LNRTVDQVLTRVAGRRWWLAVAAAVLVVLCLVPPAGTYARRYVLAESLQFAVFAVVVPALLVLGAPWRPLRLAGLMRRRDTVPAGRAAFARGVAVLVAFMGTVILWRLPPCVNALVTDPGLVVLELVTLAGAGTMLWLELVESPPLLPRLTRPQRAVFAAIPMWTIWIIAYILGFSQAVWFRAYAHPGLGSVADQEIATGILWAVSAVCFIPVVYVTALTWLRDTEDPDEGLREVTQAQDPQSRAGRWPRPPRGWNAHSA
jgi:cytochrome c oxidase assembly factor CtaG